MTELPAPVRQRRSPGARSREKGNRVERMIARMLTANGFAAAKIRRAYQPGHDIVLSLSGRDLCVEVKARANRFRELYNWLVGRDILIVKADRQEALVVLRMSLAAEIARRVSRGANSFKSRELSRALRGGSSRGRSAGDGVFGGGLRP
jgi:Holliday junction resolvase